MEWKLVRGTWGMPYLCLGWVKNDKSDVEMKLPFFFYNLNTLSSHAAVIAADAVVVGTVWHFISYLAFSSIPQHIHTHTHTHTLYSWKKERKRQRKFFSPRAVYISLLCLVSLLLLLLLLLRYRILSHLTLYILYFFFITCFLFSLHTNSAYRVCYVFLG